MKKQNKKGFTLAELLIVVAIIAVLTAIAIPLFVGALNKAQEATFDANQRSARAAVVATLLAGKDSTGKKDLDINTIFTEDKKEESFKVIVDRTTGEIGAITVKTASDEGGDSYSSWQDKGYIIVKVTLTDLQISAGS